MGIKLNNNASSLLAATINATDVTVSVTAGEGALFPVLGVGDYFYAVLQDVNDNIEIVKVTARSTDAMTIVRAQEGTTARTWAGGDIFEQRMTVQTYVDYAAEVTAASVAGALASKASLSGATFTGGINEARGTVTMHATTMDLWAQPNIIDGSGSAVTITAIANAPQAGARRTLYPITGTVITNGATFAVDGAADYTTAAGDALEFEAVTTSAYKVHITKQDGAPIQANTAKLDVAQTFTATQVADNGTGAVSTTSTYTFDGADQIREVTLTNAITVTFGAPTGITEKAMYKFMLKAGDTSARVFAWNAAYKFPSATPPLTAGATTNGAYDIINFIGGAGNTLIYDGHHANVG